MRIICHRVESPRDSRRPFAYEAAICMNFIEKPLLATYANVFNYIARALPQDDTVVVACIDRI